MIWILCQGGSSAWKSCVDVCADALSAHLNVDDGDGGLGLVEVSSHPVHCFWDEIQHQIQIHFIFLQRKKKKLIRLNSGIKHWKYLI